MDPIDIIVDIKTQQAMETLSAFVEQSRESIERTYTSAIDKAQAKYDELNRKAEQHKAIIEQLGTTVKELQSKQESASTIEQKNLDQEIQKLKSLIQAREQDILKIQEQKAKVEEKGLLAVGATEAERKALQSVYDQRMIDIGALRNTMAAQYAVKDAADASTKSAAQGLAEISEKRKVYTQVLEAEQKKLAEMQAQRENASGADQKRLDQAIEQQKRIIASRHDEALVLDAKRVKLEEEASLAAATSKNEEEGIRSVTAARLAEIEIQRDAIKTQNAMKDSIDQSGNSMESFLKSAGGMVGIVGIASTATLVLQAMGDKIEKMRQQMDGVMSATDKLANKNIDIFAATQGAFAELGITDPQAKQDALKALNSTIPGQQHLTGETVVRTAQGIGASLRAAGITDPNSSQFQDIVGNAAQGVYQGMDPALIKNVFTDMHTANPNVTGAQLNQQLANLVAIAGSPQQANELMQIEQEQKMKFGMLGMSTDDVAKMFVSAGKNGIAPDQRGQAVGGYLRGLDRFVGKTPEQYLKLYEEMTGVKQGIQGEMLGTYGKMLTPEKMLRLEMSNQFKKVQSFPELDALFQQGVSGKDVNMSQIAAVVSGMDQHRMSQVIESGGGPRALAASLAVGNWSGAQLPSGSAFAPPSTATEMAASSQSVGNFNQLQTDSANADAQRFLAQLSVEKDLLSKHPEYLPSMTRTYNESPFGVATNLRHFAGGVPHNEQVAASNVMARQFVQDAQLYRDMMSGKVPATPEQKAQLQARLQAEARHLSGDKKGAIWQAASGSDFSSLPDLTNEQWTRDWMLGNVDYQRNTSSYGDAMMSIYGTLDPSAPSMAPANQINPVAKPLPSAPQMGPPAPAKTDGKPVSVNYNNYNRNTIYGYNYNSLSDITQPTNNFG